MFQIVLSVVGVLFFMVSVLLFIAIVRKPAPVPVVLGPELEAHNQAVTRRIKCLRQVEQDLRNRRLAQPMSARTVQRRLVSHGFSVSRQEVKAALVTLVTNHHTVVATVSRRGRWLFSAC